MFNWHEPATFQSAIVQAEDWQQCQWPPKTTFFFFFFFSFFFFSPFLFAPGTASLVFYLLFIGSPGTRECYHYQKPVALLVIIFEQYWYRFGSSDQLKQVENYNCVDKEWAQKESHQG